METVAELKFEQEPVLSVLGCQVRAYTQCISDVKGGSSNFHDKITT